VDPLLRGRDLDHFPGRAERVRPGACGGRDGQSNAGEPEAVRLDLQQQVLHQHGLYPLLEQERQL